MTPYPPQYRPMYPPPGYPMRPPLPRVQTALTVTQLIVGAVAMVSLVLPIDSDASVYDFVRLLAVDDVIFAGRVIGFAPIAVALTGCSLVVHSMMRFASPSRKSGMVAANVALSAVALVAVVISFAYLASEVGVEGAGVGFWVMSFGALAVFGVSLWSLLEPRR